MFRSFAAALALVACAALAAGCQQAGDDAADPQDAPATASATAAASVASTPSPSASPTGPSAANTAAVCRRADELIIEASRRIADDSAAATRRELTPEQLNGQLKGTLAGLADDLREQAGNAENPRIRDLVTDAAKQIDTGAAAASPATWMATGFVRIPERLTRDCHV
ncbi:hypothetical protein ACFT9M_03370 [Micromonospora purpureochromogenes]|uniref:hypothetical protein n=1 Tax=Micromonospora purpureochromogenes TaxID=47872 RepID=UPI00363E7D8D